MMVGSSLLGAIFTVSGLWLSFAFDLTSGASIIMVAGIVFFLFLLVERYLIHRKRQLNTTTYSEAKPVANQSRSRHVPPM